MNDLVIDFDEVIYYIHNLSNDSWGGDMFLDGDAWWVLMVR